jgi:predicted TIM-barrel fold metal-dependent hydrolase
MSTAQQPTSFGRIYPPDEAWLAKQPPEPILDPDLPIIDPHHHLWDRPNHRYLLEDFLADVRSGHHIVATVFEECQSMYRADGPEELRPVGETEFVAGIAAMIASGLYGPTRVAAGIVGFADLILGDRAELAGYWRPYMETCIERFGPDRCMFESNFPVEKMGTTWAVLWNTFKHIAAGASAEEKLALFSGTARRVYRLD